MLNKNHTGDKGYTLVELIVAISLGFFVATMIFAGYTNMFKGFRFQAKRADTVREMIHARRAVTHALDSLGSIALLTPMKLQYINRGSRVEHTLEFRDSTVAVDQRVLVKDVKKFTFEEVNKKSQSAGRLVLWECSFKRGGWAGGAFTSKN